jgi:hypothetical protein
MLNDEFFRKISGGYSGERAGMLSEMMRFEF